MISRWCKE